MTDMRATERLLEVIEGQQDDMLALMDGFPEDSLGGTLKKKIGVSRAAITELRKRGDTLVRADDLREAVGMIEAYIGDGFEYDNSKNEAIRDRLVNATAGSPPRRTHQER